MAHLKKIKVTELKLGMYFCGFEAGWMSHPFWKSKFLLKEFADLQSARNCGIVDCWIDTEKGKDVTPTRQESASLPIEKPCSAENIFLADVEQARMLCESAKTATERMFNDVRLGHAIDMAHCLPLVEQITASVMKNSNALLSVVRLKSCDDYTYLHSVAVCALMIALARTLGMDDPACKEAGLAGLLHDIGKVFIAPELLNKNGSLTAAEYAIVQRHPVLGYEHLNRDNNVANFACEVVLHHHEKIDGSGYPDQLSGTAISTLSRMAAICDVYDAITSNRPYKNGWDPAYSLAQMVSWHGHFDKIMLSAFVKTLGIYPIGSLVKMQSARMALVIRQNPTSLTKPVVKAFVLDNGGAILSAQMIDLSAPGESDRILERGGEEGHKFGSLDKLWMYDT